SCSHKTFSRLIHRKSARPKFCLQWWAARLYISRPTSSCTVATCPEGKQFRRPLKPYACTLCHAAAARASRSPKTYDRVGTSWSPYLTCPQCGKRHDRKNRLLELGYQPGGYWKIDKC